MHNIETATLPHGVRRGTPPDYNALLTWLRKREIARDAMKARVKFLEAEEARATRESRAKPHDCALLSESIALMLDLSQARDNLRVEDWYIGRLKARVESLQ